ncbi:MAG: homocysteine S-methyltransferase family protein [Saprospiraceae bacterium]
MPLLVYPNNGDVWDAQNKCWIEKHGPEIEKNNWLEWYNYGAKIIGGCCRTQPEQMERLSAFRENLY